MAEMLGPYELRGELGRGAMAVVWRAFDTRLEREVALKEPIVPAGGDSVLGAEFGARFVREGKAAAKLNHPGIVTIHAADVYDGRPAIVMELIEGETLGQVLERGPLPTGAALAILDQLLDAVAYAHTKGVVHRDIKPDNVFITHDGRVKLADFGIAHVGTGAALTQAGTVMGTPGYMAPEQVTGSPVDARADIFAIGSIAYEMLTGVNPFGSTQGAPPTTVMYRIVHEQPAALPPQALQSLPPQFTAVIATALEKDPGCRFADAAQFRSAIAGGPIVTGNAVGAGASPQPAFAGSLNTQAAATVVSQGSGQSNWTPYLIVGGIGVFAIAGLFMFAGGGATGVAPIAPNAPAAATAGETPQETVEAEPTEHDLTGFASARASSELAPTSGYTYYASNLLDGVAETCWAEGAGGSRDNNYGVGQWVEFTFSEPVLLSEIGVVVGYDKNPGDWDRWYTNGRLRKADFYFDSGSVTHEFDDARGYQNVRIDPPKKTSTVKMYIRAAYPAEHNGGHGPSPDTSISDIRFAGLTAAEAQ